MKNPVKGPTTDKNLSGNPVIGTRSFSGKAVHPCKGKAHQMDRSTPSKGRGGMGGSKKGS